MDLINRYILWITSFKTNLQFKVGLNHCFQLFGGKIGNTSLFNQREYFFILSNNILTFFTVNRCQKMEVSLVSLFNTYIGNRMTIDRKLWCNGIFLPFSPCFQMVYDGSLYPTRPLF